MKITAFSRLRKIIRDKEDPIDFFTDPVFSNTLNNVAQIVSERYGNFPISVQMEWDNNDQRIASTNNSHIFINLDNSIVHAINGLEKKYVAYLGFLGHELGHVLYGLKEADVQLSYDGSHTIDGIEGGAVQFGDLIKLNVQYTKRIGYMNNEGFLSVPLSITKVSTSQNYWKTGD